MTDTADLVKCRKCGFPIHPSETGARHFGFYVAHSEERCTSLLQAALSSTQARADKLEAELASAQQSNENWMNRCLAAEAELAEAKRALKLAENISGVWQRKAEAAESRAAAMREALESVNKLIEWERRNGTHFALLDHEFEYVSGLWFDAKNAVVDYLKTAGKE